MRGIAPALLAVCALLPALPARAADPVAAPAVPTRPSVDALVTAMLDETALGAALGDATDREFEEMARSDKSFAAMVRRYPGIDKALGARTRKELIAIVQENIGSLRTLFADLLVKHLNAVQIDATAAMLATPSGRKLFNYGMMLGAQGGKADPPLDEAAMMKMMDPADVPALLRFESSGASEAIKALEPDLGKLGEQWGEALTRKNEDRLMTAGVETTIDYIAHMAAEPEAKTAETTSSN